MLEEISNTIMRKGRIFESNGILKGATGRLVLSIWILTLRKRREGALI